MKLLVKPKNWVHGQWNRFCVWLGVRPPVGVERFNPNDVPEEVAVEKPVAQPETLDSTTEVGSEKREVG